MHNDCIELFAYFNNKLIEALVKCTKNSLDLLKKKATIMRYFNIHALYIYLCLFHLYTIFILYLYCDFILNIDDKFMSIYMDYILAY